MYQHLLQRLLRIPYKRIMRYFCYVVAALVFLAYIGVSVWIKCHKAGSHFEVGDADNTTVTDFPDYYNYSAEGNDNVWPLQLRDTNETSLLQHEVSDNVTVTDILDCYNNTTQENITMQTPFSVEKNVTLPTIASTIEDTTDAQNISAQVKRTPDFPKDICKKHCERRFCNIGACFMSLPCKCKPLEDDRTMAEFVCFHPGPQRYLPLDYVKTYCSCLRYFIIRGNLIGAC